MKLTYDDEVGVAYLRLRGDDEDVEAPVTSQKFQPPGSEAGDDYFALDFDADGRLVGIEFLTPNERLLPSVSTAAKRPGR